LREFDETLDVFEKDISDPFGGSYEVYREGRDQIEQGIASIMKFIDEASGPSGSLQSRSRKVSITLGLDHPGFELKHMLKKYLEQQGVAVADFGTQSAISTDYPDFAQAVSQNVAGGSSDFGLLVCATGVGMSIAANKIPGIRAALVFDE